MGSNSFHLCWGQPLLVDKSVSRAIWAGDIVSTLIISPNVIGSHFVRFISKTFHDIHYFHDYGSFNVNGRVLMSAFLIQNNKSTFQTSKVEEGLLGRTKRANKKSHIKCRQTANSINVLYSLVWSLGIQKDDYMTDKKDLYSFYVE